MKRAILKKLFIIFGGVLALLVIWMVATVIQRSTDMGTGIIGGADGPTMIFLIRSHPAFFWSLFALAAFVGTGIALRVTGKVKK